MRINLNSNSNLNHQHNDDATSNTLNSSQINNASINYPNTNINSRHIVTDNQSVELTPDEFIIAINNSNLPHASITITGDVTFENNDIFNFWLPRKVIIIGELIIINCNNFTKIPSGLYVDSLSIKKCNNFTEFEDGIVINKKLKINNCNKISKLPPYLEIDKLNIIKCAELSLHSNITVKKKLLMYDCPKIINLPIVFQQIEYIIIYNLKNLILPNNLVIDGTLYLYLYNRHLPENMKLGNDLILHNCDLLNSLPNYLFVGGDIKISKCPSITSLPSSWLSDESSYLPFIDNDYVHTLLLDNTSISKEAIENYESISNMDIIVTDESIESFQQYLKFEKLLMNWQEASDNKHNIDLSNVTDNESQDMFFFLSKLANTKTFFNKVTRKSLANQVVNILQLIKDNSKMKEEILCIIHDAVSACEDRVLLNLADIIFLPLLQQAEQQSINDKEGKPLKELGRKKFFEDEILNYAVIQANKKNAEKEEVEFILAYKIKLANKFNLNFNFTTILMNYAGITNVTDADIKLAYEKITAQTTDYYFEKWLEKWAPWQKHKRKWSLKKYSQLTIKPANETSIKAKNECGISAQIADEITDLVIYKQQIYSYESLCKWYIIKGTDPFNPQAVIELNNIFAIKIPNDNPNILYKKAKFKAT